MWDGQLLSDISLVWLTVSVFIASAWKSVHPLLLAKIMKNFRQPHRKKKDEEKGKL
jgi:hypothetical protein